MNRSGVARQAKPASILPPTQGILQRKCACGEHTPAGVRCTECSKESGANLQRSAVSNRPMNGFTPIALRVQQSDSDGIHVGKSNKKRGLSAVSFQPEPKTARTAPLGVAVQLYSDPTPPPELDESRLPVVLPSSGPIPDSGAAVASIEAGAGPTVDSETAQTIQDLEDEAVQTAVQPGVVGAEPTHAVRNVAARLSSGGQPLEASAQQRLNTFFGRDFSSVRIHADAQAENLATALRAQAFTVGNGIAFGSGRYQPDTPKGQKLLAHELTHVCQQADGLGKDILAPGIGSPGDRYEREAEENAERYLRSGQGGHVGPARPITADRPTKASALQLYSGSAAASYARTWALSTNPTYPRMGNDCTNFVSQAMLAGGWTMLVGAGYCSDRKKDSVWWYRRNGCSYWWRPNVHASYTWGGAQNFYQFTKGSGRGTAAARVSDLDIGDVLQMAFSGTHIGHTMIVTNKKGGNLYLSYHTSDHLDEPFWGSGGILSRYPHVNYYAWRL
jgi:hypothetical protein